mgnify:CR=1 FL=1
MATNTPKKEPDAPKAQPPSQPEVAVRMEEVGVSFNDYPVFNNVSFELGNGEFAYLIGRTGAGKSSLLKLIYADLVPNKGRIQVDRFRLDAISPKEIPYLRRRLGIVFQDFQLLEDRSVFQNLEFVMKATGWRDGGRIKARATEVLMLVGLSSKMNSMPHELSGGEKQRTVIARAILNDPVLLIADEPTGNLDPGVTNVIMEVLQKVNRTGTAVLMATHEYSLIEQNPARVLELADGRLKDHGKVATIH